MKTEVPLQGFKICVHHHVIHLALFVAQPICMWYFENQTCDNAPTLRSAYYMAVHLWCFLSQIIADVLDQSGYSALSNIF